MYRTLSIIIAAIIIWPSVASSQEQSEEHIRDGILIRMATGFGLSPSSQDEGLTANYAGVGIPLDGDTQFGVFESLAIGYSIDTGFALHIELWGDSAVSFGIGPGITYYLMPLNLYWSASYGFSASYEDTSMTGWSANHFIGKEWWVSDNWSLGTALQLIYSDLSDVGTADEEILSVGLVFTATYN